MHFASRFFCIFCSNCLKIRAYIAFDFAKRNEEYVCGRKMHFASRFFCAFRPNCMRWREYWSFYGLFLKSKGLKCLFLRSVINNMRAVSFVFLPLIAWNDVNKKFLRVFLETKGLKYSFPWSVIKNMCAAAKRISRAASFAFFTLIAWDDENNKLLRGASLGRRSKVIIVAKWNKEYVCGRKMLFASRFFCVFHPNCSKWREWEVFTGSKTHFAKPFLFPFFALVAWNGGEYEVFNAAS